MAAQRGYRTGQNIICLINVLRLICGHGEAMLPESALEAWRSRQHDSIDWQTMQKWSEKRCDLCEQDSVGYGSPGSPDAQFLCRHVVCSDCLAERVGENQSDPAACSICGADSARAAARSSAAPTGRQLQCPATSSNKILALVRNIRQEQSTQVDPVTKRRVYLTYLPENRLI